MAEDTYEYEVINGPGLFDLAHAFFRGGSLNFTVRKKFGDNSQECWVVSVEAMSVGNDDLREEEIFRMAGIMHSSGKDFVSQSPTNVSNPEHGWSVATSYEFPHYNARTRKCNDAIATVMS